jgi:predicted ATPase with chaperone activity
MELDVIERLTVLTILPKEGSYADLKILNQLKLALSFSEQEVKDWGVRSDTELNQTFWEVSGVAEIPIGEKATDIITDSLKKLNKEKKLMENAFSIYEKFVPDND